MAKEKKPETLAEGSKALMEALRKLLLASIGVAVLAQEEAQVLVNRLVEKGQIAQEDGKKLMEDLRTRRREHLEKAIDARIEKALERFQIPTKGEIDKLSRKINDLSKKIDELKKA